MSVKLKPPTPFTTLKPTVIPLTIMRCTVIGDLMTNFGLSDHQVRIAQQGYAEGLLTGITIEGLNAFGFIEDESELSFQIIAQEVNITVDLTGGRSMIEAVSRKLAHGVAYSVGLMKRKGLRIGVRYHLSPKGMANMTESCNRLGLDPGTDKRATYADGYAGRTVLSITPGLDRGMTYTQRTARRVR